MALAGTVLGGRYVLARKVGNGGYSEVWHATDTILLRPVAVKLLYPHFAERSDVRARFQSEARHAGALAHENIARIYDYGEPADGPPFLVMELVSGPSLETMLAGGPLDARQVADIVAQAAAGLQVAHEAGLVHRDIKPANLLLAPGGVVKVTDFGISHTADSAAVTITGEVIGTPGYLAPERVEGQRGTPASDLYALGIVAYESLAGAPPFTGTPLEVAFAHRERPLPPLPPSVPRGMADLVMRLAAKDPAWRPGSAAEVAAWAGRLRDGRDGRGAAISPPARPVTVPRLRRPALTCASVAIAVIIGLIFATVIGSASPRQAGHARGSGPAAQPAAVPASSPGRRPAAGPAAQQAPAGIAPAAVTAARSGRKQPDGPGPGHGHGHGPGHRHRHSEAGT